MTKLTSFTVEGLLGRFAHRVTFEPDWDFVILHGPNGVGKTKLLELIYAVSSGRLDRLYYLPFDQATLSYEDDTTLVVRRESPDEPLFADDSIGVPRLRLILSRPGYTQADFIASSANDRLSPRMLATLERRLPIERTGPDEWFDSEYSDYLSLSEVITRYDTFIPGDRSNVEEIIPESHDAYREFVAGLSVHLIETQRLLTAAPAREAHARRSRSPVTVTRYSEDLTRRLKAALAENSTASQRLDRTFPRRVLSAEAPSASDDEIRQRYNEQLKLRDRLAEIAVLDAAEELPLTDATLSRPLQDWERRVLWTYLEDTETKLATFEPLLHRVNVLQSIVNSRFLFKKLRIDREQGFKFITDEGREIGPTALSSGEQHELVLAYDLLFNVRPGSLVLIDEPEISLHVSWQQQFLRDISRIAEIVDLRFIVATHSPQVIHKQWERAQTLYPDRAAEPSTQ